MKTVITKTIMLASLIVMSTLAANAQNKPISTTRISLEIDPATFVFKGYSFHVRMQPKSCDHLLIGAGTYAMDMPSVIVNFNKENRNKGWKVRLNQGYGLFLEQHFNEVNKKWFVGGQASFQEFKIENDRTIGSEKLSNLLFMGYAGYTFQPFNFNLYIKPWAGIGYSSKISGSNQLGDLDYHLSPITMFATLHIGYTL